jgi:hypothetical protein
VTLIPIAALQVELRPGYPTKAGAPESDWAHDGFKSMRLKAQKMDIMFNLVSQGV